MVIVHIGYKDHPRKPVFLAQLPGLFGSDLDSGLAVHNDDRRIGNADRFLHFAYEIKIAGSIQKIDLYLSFRSFVFDRDQGCRNRKLSLDLLFIVIADGIPVGYLSHSLRYSGQISQRFGNRCLSSAAMPQKHNIADFLCSINVHIDSSRTLICRRPYLGEHTRLLSAWRSARSCIQESPSRSGSQTVLPSIYL